MPCFLACQLVIFLLCCLCSLPAIAGAQNCWDLLMVGGICTVNSFISLMMWPIFTLPFHSFSMYSTIWFSVNLNCAVYSGWSHSKVASSKSFYFLQLGSMLAAPHAQIVALACSFTLISHDGAGLCHNALGCRSLLVKIILLCWRNSNMVHKIRHCNHSN